MPWQDHMTPEERERLLEIGSLKRAMQTEARRIYDRCRKRMAKAI